ncbi:MAG: GNAT family N-acetyltransferase [Dehalococcoidia bacterium]|jgi:predicted N-acetyltransferase YhbS
MAKVRLATEQDIPRILELYEELTGERHDLTRHETGPVFKEISSMSGHELLVAEEDGEVVGTVVLIIVPNFSHGALPWAIVENLVVDPTHRRRGIGRMLTEYAIARAREAGCYKLQLLSSTKRRLAHWFYKRLGFKRSAHGFRMYL